MAGTSASVLPLNYSHTQDGFGRHLRQLARLNFGDPMAAEIISGCMNADKMFGSLSLVRSLEEAKD